MKTMKTKREFYNWASNYYFLVEKTTYNLSYLFNAKLRWTSCICLNKRKYKSIIRIEPKGLKGYL